MYGAGAKKLARILGRAENAGAKIKKDFYKAHPAIEELIKDLVKTYRARGYLLSLDGRPLYSRGENKILNQLLQNAAAIIFKKWMVLCDEVKTEFIEKYKVEHIGQMIAYHDEIQFEIKSDEAIANQWGAVVCQASVAIGVEMKILVPIAAEYKVGHDWAQCH